MVTLTPDPLPDPTRVETLFPNKTYKIYEIASKYIVLGCYYQLVNLKKKNLKKKNSKNYKYSTF